MFKLFVTSVVSLTALVGSSFFFSSASLPRSAPQDVETHDGAISGRVLDAGGHPISGALVLAERTDVIVQPAPRTWTSRNGDFIIQGLTPGLYTLYTRKDDEGYPHTASNFYDEGESAELRLQVFAHQTTRNVIIQRGLKAAVLQGIIVDATTNQPLKHAQITARRVDRPDRFLSTGLFWHVGEDPLKFVEGGFKFLVPSSLAFTVKVSAPGYEDWYYRDSQTQRKPGALLLASNTTKDLHVALHRRSVRQIKK